MDEPKLTVKKKSVKKSFIDYIIISENSKWKAAFDIYITFLVAYSCFTTVYYVAFDDTPSSSLEILNYVVEGSFFADFAFNFLTEYTDPDTYQRVRSLGSISKRYVFKGWFVVDFVAIIPF
jgi:hypothetical protein